LSKPPDQLSASRSLLLLKNSIFALYLMASVFNHLCLGLFPPPQVTSGSGYAHGFMHYLCYRLAFLLTFMCVM